eukprot:TRINITY_DN1360_c0_g1_i1.p1 TRINITY_DN1360_c0_g1~~TRINITY_DN1360_c0_g1_i1.p1  ORF type:complete len:228 (-),score=74.20 TRINITY_DN1360_c0_g1_i1:430-1113(-)
MSEGRKQWITDHRQNSIDLVKAKELEILQTRLQSIDTLLQTLGDDELGDDDEYIQWYDLKYGDGTKFAKALYEFQAKTPDQLTLAIDDIGIVLNVRDDGWWEMQINDNIGLTPGNYWEVITEDEVREMSLGAGSKEISTGDAEGLEQELKSLREEYKSLTPEIARLEEEIENLKTERQDVWTSTKQVVETIGPQYYRISPLHRAFNDVQSLIGTIDVLHDQEKKVCR